MTAISPHITKSRSFEYTSYEILPFSNKRERWRNNGSLPWFLLLTITNKENIPYQLIKGQEAVSPEKAISLGFSGRQTFNGSIAVWRQ